MEEAAMTRRSLLKPLTRPAAGPVASIVALALAGALAGSLVHAARTEAALKADLARVTVQSQQAALMWKASLSTCRAHAAAPEPPGGRITPVAEDGDVVAARLATVGPAGFDDCARMEAADAAVLSSLRAK
jgi:hypothetical protein